MNNIIVRVKTILWIVDDAYDNYLSEVVPILLRKAEKYCGQEWRDDDDAPEDVPGPVVMFIARAAEVLLQNEGVKSESLGDYSITLAQGHINTLKTQYLTDYRQMEF